MKHEWNKTQIKALKSSILHWKTMRNDAIGQLGLSECACCREFNSGKGVAGDCADCPLSIYTERQFCHGTPYWDAEEIEEEHDIDSPEFKKAAQEMINFMNKVLKAGTGNK